MAYVWHSTSDQQVYDILKNRSNVILNRYPLVKDIARKDNFESMMNIAAEENSEYDFTPRTFLFP